MAASTIRWAGMRLTVEGAAEFQKKLKDVNNQLKTSQAELNKVTNAFGKNEQNAETLAAKHQHLTEALNLNAERQQALNMVLDDAIQRYGENSSEVLGLRASLAEAEAEQVKLERALRETEQAIRAQPWNELGDKLENAGKRMQAVGDRMQSVGKGLSLAVTAPLTALAVQALRVGADFESSMGTIRANTGMTADEVDGLGRSFRDMAASGNYGTFTAREVANAYADIAVKGQDAAYATELMRSAMVLATARNMDLGAAAYFLGNYLLKVGKDASYAEKYVNVFAVTSQKTQIGLASLQDYLFRTNVTLQSTNISGTEAAGMFGRLYQQGIRGAQAYSGLENAMRMLLVPTEKQIEALHRLEVARKDDNGQLRDGIPFLLDVAAALSDLEGAYLAYYNQLLGSTAMGAAFLGGMVDIKDTLPDTIAELYEVANAAEGAGAAFEMAAINQEGLVGSTAQMRARFEEMKLQIADQLLPVATMFMDNVSGLIERLTSLDEGTQRTVVKMAALAAGVGPVLVVGGKLVSFAGKATTKMGALSKAIGAAGGAKAYLALKFPAITAGMQAASTATAANTKATAANTKAQAAFVKSKLGNIAALKAYTTATAAASVKMTAFAGGMKAKAASMGIVKKALALTSAGFIKLTAVMLANPIGAIVAGVAALVGGITALVLWLNRAGEEYKEMAAASEAWLERQREITEGAAAQAEAFQDNAREMQNNGEHIRNLAEQLDYLSSKQGLTAGEMAEMEGIIAELNSSVDGLSLSFDEQTGALNMTTEALEKYLAAAEMQAALDAGLAERSRLQREAIELAAEKYEAETRLLELQEKTEDGSRRNRRERNLLSEAIENEKEALALLAETMAANGEMQDALTDSIEVHASALEDVQRAQAEAAAAIEETTGAMEAQAFTMEEWERAHSEAMTKVERAFESYKRVASNAFETASERAAISVADMTSNLLENTRAVEEWSKNMAILAERGVDEGLLEQLRRAGVEGAATVRELVAACDEELDALNDAFQDSTRIAVESMRRELDPEGITESAEGLINHVAQTILENDSMESALITTVNNAFSALDNEINNIGFSGLGENTVTGYVDGINNMLPDVDRAGQDTASTYLDAVKNIMDQNSPSRAMRQIGVYVGEGLIQGTRDIQPQTEEIARTLATAFIRNVAETIDRSQDIDNSIRRQVEDLRRTAENAVAAANFDGIGFEMVNGINRGLNNGSGMLSSTASNIINNALSSMRAAAAISSPSRKTWKIAQQLIDGMTGGLNSKMSELAAYCKRITDKVTDSLYIDPSELVANSREVLGSLQAALPALESNIHHTTSAQATSKASPATPQAAPINFNFGDVYVREDSDIEKIVNMALRKLGKEVSYKDKIGGFA